MPQLSRHASGGGHIDFSRGLSLLTELNIIFLISVTIYNVLSVFIFHKPFVWAFEETAHIGILVFANYIGIYLIRRKIVDEFYLS